MPESTVHPYDCTHLDVIVQRNNGERWLTCLVCMTDFVPAAAVEWWENAARKHGYCLGCGAPDGYPLHVYGMRKCCPDCSHTTPDHEPDNGSTEPCPGDGSTIRGTHKWPPREACRNGSTGRED